MSEDWIEIEGRNRDDAIERACNALNTTPSYLEFEVLSGNGSKIRARKTTDKIEGREKVTDDQDEDEEQPSARPESEQSDSSEERTQPEVELMPIDPTEVGLKAKEMLDGLLHFIEEGTQVSLKETTGTVVLDIQSNGSGLLIGKHGQTLEAIQHLVAKMSGLDRQDSKRLLIDSEGYRQRRKDSLIALAHKVAARVRRERRPVSIDPMSSADRRVLHLALQDDPDVVTKSVGEGRNRKVMICPRGGSRRGGSSRGGYRSRSRSNGADRRESSLGERPARRRSGPPARKHDSFDVPPDPKMDLFPEDPDAPRISDVEASDNDE